MNKIYAAAICILGIMVLLYSIYARIISYRKKLTQKSFFLKTIVHEKSLVLQEMLILMSADVQADQLFCNEFKMLCYEVLLAETAQDLAQRDSKVSQEIPALFRMIEYSSSLKSSPSIVELQGKLVSCDTRLEKAIIEYNNLVRFYNLVISFFPARLIAYFLKAKKIDFFVLKNA